MEVLQGVPSPKQALDTEAPGVGASGNHSLVEPGL